MNRSGVTPNFFSTPASSSVSFDIVLTSVTLGVTSCAMSLSPVEMMTRAPRRSASFVSVPITSSASTPFDGEQRPAHGADRLVQRIDLRRQVVGHAFAVRLVLRIDVVAEGLSLRVENHGAIIRGRILVQLAKHVQHAVNGARRLAFGIA